MASFSLIMGKVGGEKVTLHARNVKQWARSALADTSMQDEVISVAQVHCYEPDCVPLETVISLMSKPPLCLKS